MSFNAKSVGSIEIVMQRKEKKSKANDTIITSPIRYWENK